jgi:ribonuclease P protein component
MKATKKQIQVLSRLSQQAAFDSLRKTKTRWVSKGFSLQVIPTENRPTDSGDLKFCVITSKHAAKLATDRNKMRRRLRAVAYEILTTAAKQGMTYMIVARKDSLTLSMDDLRKDLKWCLKKLNLNQDDNKTDTTAH